MEAGRLFPGRPHHNTVIRWARKGYHGVRLKTFRCGMRTFTTPEWAREFVEETTQLHEKRFSEASHQADAESRLDRLGVTTKAK